MASKSKVAPRPRPISGFPEWLPQYRRVEQRWIDQIRGVFESYGFTSLETPSVEEVDVLTAKGEDVDKEIYGVQRLQAEADADESRIALHYDLTVPLARYVAQHLGELTFPFKRYQIQRAWRGERPQEGRFREFTQCDIDVIDQGGLSLQFDAELPAILLEILVRLEIGNVTLHVNNRKILEGFYRGLGIEDRVSVIRVVDKLDKIGARGVADLLSSRLALADAAIQSCLELADIRTSDTSFVDRIRSLGVRSELLDEGLDELAFVIEALPREPKGRVLADLSIARGFDYYTGTVYEGRFVDFPGYPSICSGGRYDDLAGSYARQRLPGVGVSIGLTRIFAKLVKEGRVEAGPQCPTQVLVVHPPQREWKEIAAVAETLRSRGLNVEMYHEPRKLGAQLRYASRKGIPHVWFPPFDGEGSHEVKDMESGEQHPADLRSWRPGG